MRHQHGTGAHRQQRERASAFGFKTKRRQQRREDTCCGNDCYGRAALCSFEYSRQDKRSQQAQTTGAEAWTECVGNPERFDHFSKCATGGGQQQDVSGFVKCFNKPRMVSGVRPAPKPVATDTSSNTKNTLNL